MDSARIEMEDEDFLVRMVVGGDEPLTIGTGIERRLTQAGFLRRIGQWAVVTESGMARARARGKPAAREIRPSDPAGPILSQASGRIAS